MEDCEEGELRLELLDASVEGEGEGGPGGPGWPARSDMFTVYVCCMRREYTVGETRG